jgi:hypothetical protein
LPYCYWRSESKESGNEGGDESESENEGGGETDSDAFAFATAAAVVFHASNGLFLSIRIWVYAIAAPALVGTIFLMQHYLTQVRIVVLLHAKPLIAKQNGYTNALGYSSPVLFGVDVNESLLINLKRIMGLL